MCIKRGRSADRSGHAGLNEMQRIQWGEVRRWIVKGWWQLALVAVASFAAVTYSSHVAELRSTANAEAAERSRERADRRAADDERVAREKKAYVAKRRGECYDIYSRERAKFNNVVAPAYNEFRDVCEVRYKRSTPDPSCPRILALPDSILFASSIMLARLEDCEGKTFRNEF